MNAEVKTAHDELARLVENSPVTRGLRLRVSGKIVTIARLVSTPDGSGELDDRLRLTHLGGAQFGLSVMRHTGKWEKSPFSGSITELFDVISGPMQHLVAAW
jgi:hypothetical protein